jgi:hypothetical protein
MKGTILTMSLLLGTALSASPSYGHGGPFCRAHVLLSEELVGAPIYQNRVRAVLEIIPPVGPAFQATVNRLLLWQVPPPRQGQTFRLRCEAVSAGQFAITD